MRSEDLTGQPPIRPVGIPPAGRGAQPSGAASGAGSFGEVLAGQIAAPRTEATYGPKFSTHALKRMGERGIALDAAQRLALDEGFGRAAGKGAARSLFLMEDLGFIVDVPSRTVVTVLTGAETAERVFTDIDSTLILRPGRNR